MANRQLPEIDLLHKLIEYDSSTGLFTWKPRSVELFDDSKGEAWWRAKIWNKKNAGKLALNNPHGVLKLHLSGGIFGEIWLAHRIAWGMHYNVRDFDVIDHIDGDGTNNKIFNLRTANMAVNARNAAMRKDSSSGIAGVHWHVGRWGRPVWVARVQINGKRHFLGSFDDIEDAKSARLHALAKYGFGPSHGKAKT
jgi:HNH endonuclease